MKFSAYFEEQVLRRRPYIRKDWCVSAVERPDSSVTQIDGRVRYWKFITALGKYLRVIVLQDGETIHNAFPDRNFEMNE